MPRTPIVGGNWKMNTDLAQAGTLAAEVRHRLGSQRGCDVVVFPPFPFLRPVTERLDGCRVEVGAQDVATEAKGAFTGAVAGAMIASCGASWVLIGHSERRSVFGDSDAVVAKKLSAALAVGLKPVLCVGESRSEREAGQTFAVVRRQLESALAGLATDTLRALVIAYEPVWAIGTGLVATPAQAQEVHAFVRGTVADLLGRAFADAVRLQYGGSVKADNAAGLWAQPDIDGFLVGGASLEAEGFAAIVRARRAD
ncbi:MAG: triose-phosphate isomerase [Myxococcales bacterium]|nr:triose-phosphate isomerase [Myxococcales bacterium]